MHSIVDAPHNTVYICENIFHFTMTGRFFLQKVCSSYLIDSQVETTDLGFWAFRSFLGGGSEENITNIILIFVI